MSDQYSSECGCGIEVTPADTSINIAPSAEFNNQQAALLSPKPVVPAASPININVYIKDTEQPTAASAEDNIDFILNFSVSAYDEATGISNIFTVPKRISVSKRRLLADGQMNVANLPAVVIEQVKKEVKKTDAQRVRELAGIPHKKNHV